MIKYDMPMETDPETIPGMIVSRIQPGSSVLEFGCSTGRMTKYMRETLHCAVSIVEINPEAYDKAQHYAVNGFCGDIDSGDWQSAFSGNQYDVILFADVLEHLKNPMEALRNAGSYLKQSGEILVSLPNIGHFDILANLYLNRFNYTEIGLLDNTHVHFWGKDDLADFFRQAGFTLALLDGVYLPPYETEQKVDRSLISDETNRILMKHRYYDVYQFFCVLKKTEWTNKEHMQLVSRLESHGIGSPAYFYWDMGFGYQADAYTKAFADMGTWTNYRVEKIPDHCKKVCFEPVLGEACTVHNLSVKSNCGICKTTVLNGSEIDDVIVFSTLNPQIEIDLPENAVWIEVTATVESVTDVEGIQRLSLLEQIPQLRQKEAKLGLVLGQLAEKESQLTDARQELEEVRGALSSAKEQVKALTDHLQERNDYAFQVETQYHDLANQYNTVVGSTCWRITAPLRSVLDKIKGLHFVQYFQRGLQYLQKFGFRATLRETRYRMMQRTAAVTLTIQKVDSFSALEKQLRKNSIGNGIRIYLPGVLKKYDQNSAKKVLIISHELSLTGAPVAIRYLAQDLKDEGLCPVILSPRNGILAEQIAADGIPIIVLPTLLTSDVIREFAELFDLVIANTIVTAPVIQNMNGLNTPVLWWIHEAEASFTPELLNCMPEILPEGISAYAGGSYAKKMLKKYRPYYAVQELLYYVPDSAAQPEQALYQLPEYAKGKTVFCIVGMLEYRKGQDILAQALLDMPAEQLQHGYFIFVGKKCCPENYQQIMQLRGKYPRNVLYIEELSTQELNSLYRQMDCLICASRDDPLPIVVTEAMEYSKVIICSENTGSASILSSEKAGIIYKNNSSAELRNCIQTVLDNPYDFVDMRTAARRAYEKFFSRVAFRANSNQVIYPLLFNMEKYGTEDRIFPVISLSFKALIEDYCHSKEDKDRLEGIDQVYSYDNIPRTKRILLVSHELSLTGAPVALQHLAESFRRQGAQVLIVSPYDGPMTEEFANVGFPVMIYTKLYQDGFLARHAETFDLIVLSTVVCFLAIEQLRFSKTNVLWWIHDSEATYRIGGFENILPKELPGNVIIYCGGAYAREKLLNYYPQYSAKIMYYMVPDMAEIAKSYPVLDIQKIQGRFLFTEIGQQDMRKGHDIFAKAIELLSCEDREQAQFCFIGSYKDKPIREAVEKVCSLYPSQVSYIPNVNRQQLFSVYQQSDCIVCSSRDDPLPVFVTEAMMMSKFIICSENTGSAPILEQEQCGLIYHNDNPQELAMKMHQLLQDQTMFQPMRGRARNAYQKLFSEEAFGAQVQTVLTQHSWKEKSLVFDGTVSVIIPTFNGGQQLEKLVKCLNSQVGIRKIEVVVVDSGSKDDTVERCKACGAIVIQIPNEKFSHSYARNLGASCACGDILIFMTQDAIPENERWMERMITPICSGEAIATSCKERCPEETELYYKIAAWNHAKYIGVYTADQLNTLNQVDSMDDLRRKASLNDVSSAIQTAVFKRFLYRFNYAEDLDMGLRLLQNGYPIKLLGSTEVIHGHTRPAGYYIKRSFVETQALGQIYKGWRLPEEAAEPVCRQILFADVVLSRGIIKTRNRVSGNCETESFIQLLSASWQEEIKQMAGRTTLEIEKKDRDPLLQWCLEKVQPWAQVSDKSEDQLCLHILYYFSNVLCAYLMEEHCAVVDDELQNALYDCAEKQFCMLVGTELSRITKSSGLYPQLQGLGRGV